MSKKAKAGLSEGDVEKFLLHNPKFLENWMAKHGTPEMIRMFSGGSKEEEPGPVIVPDKPPKFNQFARNSITTSIFKRYVEGAVRQTKAKANKQALLAMNESELLMELIKDISSELDVNVLCHKILQNVGILTRSDRGSLFLARGTKDNKYLVSKLFDVTETSTLEESVHTEETEIKVPFGRGIAGHVALTKETVNIKDAYEDPRFNKEVDKKTGYRTHSILCMPILNFENDVVGVAQIINKVTGNHEFTQQDEEVFRKYLIFCGVGLTNAQLFEMSVQEMKRNKLLLSLARGVFEEQANLEKLVQKIMLDAQDLLRCEKCSVYLVDDPMAQDDTRKPSEDNVVGYKPPTNVKDVVFSRAFELYAKDDGNIHVPSADLLKKSKNAEVARHVVVTAEPLCIADLEADGSFGKGPFIDEEGFHTKGILCMPIFNNEKQVIGVTQQVNKTNGRPFTENDANIIEAFSIFTGLGIHNCQMYENACKLMAKQTVALEVLSYHATASQEEAEKLANSDIPDGKQLELYCFDFNDMKLSDQETCKACVAMFKEAGCIDTFKIPEDRLCRWVLSVKKNYRPVTYHNWRHAFNVAQTMFTMLFTGGLAPIFNHLDTLALLVACVCHDLDHRGTNNAFQVKVASPLAMLYSTSVLEHHHFDHCIMILNSEGNNIFASLSSEDYRSVIKMLEFCILSTDLALYFRKRGQFKQLIESKDTDFATNEKKDLLKAMMMTACDVAAITKPWEVQKEVAQLVANEFFEQGDIEKTELGEKPIAMMDREKQDELPKMQVGFIDAICLPVYELFAELNPGLSPLYEGVKNNRQQWQNLAEEKMKAEGGEGNVSDSEKISKSKGDEGEKKISDGNSIKSKGNQQKPLKSVLKSDSKKDKTKKKATVVDPKKKTTICSIV